MRLPKRSAESTGAYRETNESSKTRTNQRLHQLIVVGLYIGIFSGLFGFNPRDPRNMDGLKQYAVTSVYRVRHEVSVTTTANNSTRTILYKTVSLFNESLAHIQRAGLVNLTYVNVTDNYTSHPHQGALDENGLPGYVHDVTHLRGNPPPFSWNETTMRGECSKNNITVDSYNFPALQRLQVADFASSSTPKSEATTPRSKILCVVYTSEHLHGNLHKIRETWGPKCDGFFAASNKTDRALDAVNILHAGPESYGNMWQKVRSIWSYIYDNYYEEYDWFHLGGEDMWVIVENLRAYVDSDEIRAVANGGTLLPMANQPQQEQVPLYLGCRFAQGGNIAESYNTGGPGYTLNRAALKLLVVQGLPNWYQNQQKAHEDLFTGLIFNNLNVSVYNTRDEQGSERYMHFPPGRMYHGHEPPFYRRWTGPFQPIKGQNHSSVYSIAFHYIKDADEMRRFHATIYGLCPAVE